MQTKKPAAPSRRQALILNGPVGTTLVRLAAPLVLSHQLMMVAPVIALFWMGYYNGEDGLAVMSIVGPWQQAIFWALSAIGVGASSLIARSIGAGDQQGLTIMRSAAWLTLVASVLLGGLGLVFLQPLSVYLAGSVDIAPRIAEFLGVWLCFLLAFHLSDLYLESAHATGWTSFGLIRVTADLVLMVALAPVFMGGLGMGVAGLPLAMGVSTAVLCLVMRAAIMRRKEDLGLGTEPARAGRTQQWKDILTIGGPARLSRAVSGVVAGLMIQVIMRDGKPSVAGFVAAYTLLLVFWIVTMALSSGTAIMVGQNFGAGNSPRRVASILLSAIGFAICYGLFMGILAPHFEPVLALFVDSDEVVGRAMVALGIMKWSVLTVGLFHILLATFTATGKTRAAGTVSMIVDVTGLVIAFRLGGSGLENVAMLNIFLPLAKALLLACLLRDAFWRPVVERSRIRQLATTQE